MFVFMIFVRISLRYSRLSFRSFSPPKRFYTIALLISCELLSLCHSFSFFAITSKFFHASCSFKINLNLNFLAHCDKKFIQEISKTGANLLFMIVEMVAQRCRMMFKVDEFNLNTINRLDSQHLNARLFFFLNKE